MNDDLKVFKPKISDIENTNGELRFILSGDDDYGFDKSLVNAVRRILLTDIPTVGFNLTENGDNNDLIMVINNSSLHNEMLLHRISFMPLYLDPVNYMLESWHVVRFLGLLVANIEGSPIHVLEWSLVLHRVVGRNHIVLN